MELPEAPLTRTYNQSVVLTSRKALVVLALAVLVLAGAAAIPAVLIHVGPLPAPADAVSPAASDNLGQNQTALLAIAICGHLPRATL